MAPFFTFNASSKQITEKKRVEIPETIKLPQPIYKGWTTVEEALFERRSINSFANLPLTIREISQLLWAAYGVTEKTKPGLQRRLKTAPSIGRCFPLEVYIVIGKVLTMKMGVYKYAPEMHTLIPMAMGDKRTKLCHALNNEQIVKSAPAILVYCAVFDRTTAKYGIKGFNRFVGIDLGHSAQNVYLQALSLKLATFAIGDFNDELVSEILPFSLDETPLYILPCGKKALV